MSAAPSGERIVLSLVSHTNVGKTTLARTLLRRDVGEVFDQAHVTDESEAFPLAESAAGGEVVLADNPGFGDSARLLRRLRGMPNPLGWLVAQVWDRFTDRALFCSQRAVRHVRDEADVVLYLVNASEDPAAAGYVEPELEILGWIGRPVIVLLNQTGAPADAAARAADVGRWRAHAEAHAVVRDVLPLDAFSRCWIQEGLLFERIRDLLPPERRAPLDALIERWRDAQQGALRRSLEALADLVGAAAADGEPALPGALGRGERQRAADALARRLEEAVANANERLIAEHGLTGEAAEELRIELADVTAPADHAPPWRRGMVGAAVGGALGGLVADVATGGLSLGGGAIAGAILGAAGAGGLAWGMELLRGEAAPPQVVWSAEFLDRLCDDVLLRYLAVAHFGRGAGAFRVREHPALFRAVAARALAPQRDGLREVFRQARAEPGAAAQRDAALGALPPLGSAARAALAELYPEGVAFLTRPDGTRMGTTAGSSVRVTGVVPQ